MKQCRIFILFQQIALIPATASGILVQKRTVAPEPKSADVRVLISCAKFRSTATFFRPFEQYSLCFDIRRGCSDTLSLPPEVEREILQNSQRGRTQRNQAARIDLARIRGQKICQTKVKSCFSTTAVCNKDRIFHGNFPEIWMPGFFLRVECLVCCNRLPIL
jgi:hypothetical protein